MAQDDKSGARRRISLISAIVAAVAVAGGLYLTAGGGEEEPGWRLATVQQGPISRIVSASGSLRAVITVAVGSQVSGQITELLADFNTKVRAGQVVARLDPAQFQAKLRQAEAEVAVARANVTMQNAALSEQQAELRGARAARAEAGQDLERKQALLKRRVVSRSVVDKARAGSVQARARVAASSAKVKRQKAQIQTARAQVQQKEAALEQRRLDLEHTIIRSPVDGVVISRSVDVGQTVAASLQAPTLFTIAQDLAHMQVEVSVDEADIGQIQVGQDARFSVDSFPGQEFPGRVRQVRKAPITVSNVVTYTVVVSADNSEQRLLPGMTANVNIVIGRRDNALKVPNAALRFQPPGVAAATPGRQQHAGGGVRRGGAGRSERALRRMTRQLDLKPEQQAKIRDIFQRSGRHIGMMRSQGASREEIREYVQKVRRQNHPLILAVLDPAQKKKYETMRAARRAAPLQQGRVWVLGPGDKPKAVQLRYGISNGSETEIVAEGIARGQQVIVGYSGGAREKPKSRPRFGF